MEFSWDNIDIRSICEDFLKNIWVILLAVVAAFFGITGIYTLQYVPEYTSSATLAITMRGKNGSAYSSLYMTKDMSEIFKEVFESEALGNKIADSIGADSIDGKISIELISETNLMTLSVVSDSPKNAYLTIGAALENYETVSDYLFSNAKLDILKAPSLPSAPSNPLNVSKVRKIAMLLAAGFTVCLIILLSYLRPTVKSVKKAKHQLDGKIIGVIPYARKYRTRKERIHQMLRLSNKKKSLLISSAMLGTRFIESLKNVATRIEGHMRRHGEKVLVITSVAENEGKSTVIANIAIALAERGYRVLLIDGDLKKPALYRIFDMVKVKDSSLTDCFTKKRNYKEIMVEEPTGVTVMYQYHGVSDSGRFFNNRDMGELIEQCREEFDYILIDTPPMGISVDAETLLQYADAVAITVREDSVELGVINDSAEVARRAKKDFVGFVLNAFHSSSLMPSSSEKYGYYEAYSKKREV